VVLAPFTDISAKAADSGTSNSIASDEAAPLRAVSEYLPGGSRLLAIQRPASSAWTLRENVVPLSSDISRLAAEPGAPSPLKVTLPLGSTATVGAATESRRPQEKMIKRIRSRATTALKPSYGGMNLLAADI